MSAPKLAETTFVAGPDDSLIVVDVYGNGGGGVVNSYQETHPAEIDPLGAAGGGGSGGGGGGGSGGSGGGGGGGGGSGGGSGGGEGDSGEEDFTPTSDYGDTAPNNDLSDLSGGLDGAPDVGTALEASRLSSGDSDIYSDIEALDDDMRSAFNMPENMLDNVVHQLGDVVTDIASNLNFNSMQTLNNLVGRLSGEGDFGAIKDLGGMASLVSSVAQTASRAGIPNVFNNILAGGRFAQDVMTSAVTNMIPGIVKNANIMLLGDVARSPFGKILAAASPNIIGNTIRAIARPTNLRQDEYSDYYGNARDTFSQVDSNWNKTPFGQFHGAIDATVVSQNPFLQTTLKANVATRPLYVEAIGDDYSNRMDTYDPARPVYTPESGGKIWNDEGELVAVEPQVLYDRQTQYRREDSLMAAATAFPARTVDVFIQNTFPDVKTIVNRTFRL